MVEPKEFAWDFNAAKTQAGVDVKALHDFIGDSANAFASATTKDKYIRWVRFGRQLMCKCCVLRVSD
jgi:hypothetical protein